MRCRNRKCLFFKEINVRPRGVLRVLDKYNWYSPRDGLIYDAEFRQVQSPFVTLSVKGAHTFTPPSSGEPGLVLVLDDVAAGFPAPGARL